MLSYIEWGISLLTILICSWKYGWRVKDMLRALRHLYKKFESLLVVTPPPEVRERKIHRNKWKEARFLSIPVTRAQFNKKTYERPLHHSKKQLPTELGFFKTLPRTYRRDERERSPSLSCPPVPVCCSACRKRDEVPVSEKISPELDLKNCFDCETREPHNPWYIRRFAYFIFFWRKWFIGPQYNMVPLKDMLEDERVNQTVLDIARQEFRENPDGEPLDVVIKKHQLRAEKLILNMRAKQAGHPYFSIYCRIASWIIGKTLNRIYPEVLVRKSQLDGLRKARATGHPILYLPVHRSHVDYVLVSWVLVASDIRAPLVAAGDNLNIPIFHLMMRSVGGFFIKRRLDRRAGKRDILYRTVLQSYMERSILDDNDLEFFIEGGRTRTGKPCHPKGGLLSIAVDSLMTKKVEDILVVPVNFSYERLLDGDYIREQLGKPKQKESFVSAAMALWNSVQTKFGNARVDFGKPFSVKEFMHSYKQWKSASPLPGMSGNSSDGSCSETDQNNNENTNSNRNQLTEPGDIRVEDQRDFINNLAQHVIYDGVKNLCLTSTNVIAFLLLNKFRDGVSVQKLAKEMELLKQDLNSKNHDVGFSGDMRKVINHGITILGPHLITRELVRIEAPRDPTQKTRPTEIILKPVTELPNVLDLAYYSTCILPIYVMESVIATSIFVLKGPELRDLPDVREACHVTDVELISTCIELCGILQHEFIFQPPCQTLEETIRKSLEDMRTQGLIRFNRTRCGSAESEDELSFRSIDLIYINKEEDAVQKLKFLQGLISPIVDTYTVSSLVLNRLIGCEAPEKHLQMDMLAEVRSHLQQHFIKYGESLALDPIRNFVKLLLGWQVLESYPNEPVAIYFLGEIFDTEEGVDNVIRRIRRFQV